MPTCEKAMVVLQDEPAWNDPMTVCEWLAMAKQAAQEPGPIAQDLAGSLAGRLPLCDTLGLEYT